MSARTLRSLHLPAGRTDRTIAACLCPQPTRPSCGVQPLNLSHRFLSWSAVRCHLESHCWPFPCLISSPSLSLHMRGLGRNLCLITNQRNNQLSAIMRISSFPSRVYIGRPWMITRTYYYPTNNQVSVNCLSTKRTRTYF